MCNDDDNEVVADEAEGEEEDAEGDDCADDGGCDACADGTEASCLLFTRPAAAARLRSAEGCKDGARADVEEGEGENALNARAATAFASSPAELFSRSA